MRGAGRFLDDLAPARHLVVAFVRSLHAHAGIRAIDTARARARPGVVAPIILLTASHDLRERCRRVGADGCLPKPFALDALLAAVEAQAHTHSG